MASTAGCARLNKHSMLSRGHHSPRANHICKSTPDHGGRPLVQYKPKAREVAPAPEEVPVVHSSTYLLREKKKQFQGETRVNIAKEEHAHSPTNGTTNDNENAVAWALKQADAYFDKVEAESSESSTVRVLVKNPATRATMKTMQGVTTLGAATAPQIARAAVPIGKKLLSMSADVLVAGLTAINDASKKKKGKKD